MKNFAIRSACLFASVMLILPVEIWAKAPSKSARKELKKQYDIVCTSPSDIYEHIPVLRELAKECSSAIEIGVRTMNSTWGILLGLSESRAKRPSYLGIDLCEPPMNIFVLARKLSESNGVSFNFWVDNDMNVVCPGSDLLFIDSLHTYAHLTYELEKFSPSITKYIALHDTSDPWGDRDDTEYHGDYSEYPASINKTKRGLWLAVVDFLERHPEWELQERRLNCHGFTVLRRL